MSHWLALVIGNSRLHWAIFNQEIFLKAWHTPHISSQASNIQAQPSVTWPHWQAQVEQSIAPYDIGLQNISQLWIASVVPSQTQLWQNANSTDLSIYWINRDAVPLEGVYSSLGIDRLMTLWGAGSIYGWPTLVIDAGTALTFTAGLEHQLVGGAILPGLQLQIKALMQHTAALPHVSLPDCLPNRWANTTIEAIQSGVLYTALASIRDYCHHWRGQYPNSSVLITGGDGETLYHYLTHPQLTHPPTTNHSQTASAIEAAHLKHQTPMAITGVQHDPYLMFWGIRAYRNLTQGSNSSVVG